jgi:ribonucleotide monophosphatase NagD (HAD superfamily)
MVTPQLTNFQSETERELVERLRQQRVELSERQIVGSSDASVEATVNGIRIWISPDGACVIGRGTDTVFEKPDYATLDDLRAAFIDKVLEVLKRK